MTDWTNQFGNTAVQVSQPSYRAISFSANTTLVWPEAQSTSTNIVALINDCSASVGSLSLTMPDATQVSAGREVLLANVGEDSFTVKDSAGSTITTVATSTVVYIYQTSNSTAAGSWRVTVFGATTSGADANALDGYGLTVISSLLNTSHPVTSTAVTPTTLVAADRASLQVWTGGAGTFALTAAATLGNNWFALVSNQGSGVLTIDPNGSETIDGDATKALQQDESLFVVCNGTGFFSVGYGRAVASTVTRLSKSVAGSSDVTLTASEAANTLIAFTGVLTGNISVIVPTSAAIYDVTNSTTGAYSLTVKTTAGTGIDVPQGTRAALYCDATNVVEAQDPKALVNAQTGTTYTVLNSDRAKLITHTNASAIAVTLPQAGGSAEFTKGWYAYVQNRGAGAVTYTPATSTIDGAASLVIQQNQGFFLVSDGTNYFTSRGIGFTDPMTTRGDIITRGASAAQRLALGTTGQILRSDGTDTVWASVATALGALVTTRGDLITRDGSTVIRLPVGTANQILATDGTDVAWRGLSAEIDAAIGSTQGNILYRNNTAWVVLATGTNGHYLQTQGAAANPQWAALSLSAGSVTQSILSTTTGTVTQVSTGSSNNTLPGGSYGFYPQIKYEGGGGAGDNCGAMFFGTVSSPDCQVTTGLGSTLVASMQLFTGGTGTMTAQQRYVQASPPYDLGDGPVQGFIFALLEEGTGKVLATYAATEAPWIYNGPTIVTPTRVCQKTGRKFIVRKQRIITIADVRAGRASLTEYGASACEDVESEITQAVYHADMPLIPHPFVGNDLTGKVVVLLDPMDKAIGRLLADQDEGESIAALFRDGVIKIDNEALVRSGPAGVMQAAIRL